MQITLIRHGSTAGNLEHRYVGRTDEPLTEDTIERLKDTDARYPRRELLFVSPMLRCRQTAELIYPGQEQMLEEELCECDFGLFEYGNYLELQDQAAYQDWIASGGTLPFPEGESRTEFSQRCCMAFEKCCRIAWQRGCKSAAFVVHGGTIMAIMERFARPQKDYFDWQVKNLEGFTGVLCQNRNGSRIPLSELEVQTGTLEILDIRKIKHA